MALVSPVEDAVTLAVPAVVGVKLEAATPLAAVTGEAGLKEPETPLTEKGTGLLAEVTVAPLVQYLEKVRRRPSTYRKVFLTLADELDWLGE